MLISNNEQNLFTNTLELHYWFKDSSHTMDAFIQNRCENEILGILKEISVCLDYKALSIETFPLEEGGLIRLLKIVSNEDDQKKQITSALIIALLTAILVSPIAKISEKLIDKIFEDKEVSSIKKEILKEQLIQLRLDNELKIQKLEENTLIKKRKSNYYQALQKYPKIEKVTYQLSSNRKVNIGDFQKVEKENFNDFILTTDELEPFEIENAIIEIISPVLKKGKYMWTGYYNEKPIYFTMKSNEFKTLVQTGKVEFKNGSSIKCFLVIKRKINNDGETRITGYEVLRVDEYFQNNKPIETSEGKKHKKIKDAEKRQTKLF